jgi:tetratricopeptide (TPR) repeat protein
MRHRRSVVSTALLFLLLAAPATAVAQDGATEPPAAGSKPAPPGPDPRVAAAAEAKVEVALLKLAGSKLTKEQAAELEKQLEQSPDDVDTRIKLLAFYTGRMSAAARQGRNRHVSWLIENRPRHAVCGTVLSTVNQTFEAETYDQGLKLWRRQIETHPDDATLYGHAARFVLRNDPAAALDFLAGAKAVDPDNPEWPRRLAGLYTLMSVHGPAGMREESGGLAYAEWKDAYAITPAERRINLYVPLSKAAWNAREHADAREWADRALAAVDELQQRNAHGEAVLTGHLVLGRLALREGDVEAAKRHLLAAGRTPGSPMLNSFGPSMALADELLREGHREVVLEYFELCRKFWKSGATTLDYWVETVHKGYLPDFGNHLLL